ncbi:MAG: DinB family protein [Planctomycetota bacterium]|nr:MAG: DinB family protein [Planctomycetota bacterium]
MTSTMDWLLILVDQCFDRKAWHGPHLKAAIRGVDAAQAVWRPQPRRHNIAEQVLHAAYWKYVVRRKLRGDKRGSFPLKGTNWFPVRGKLRDEAWAEHKNLLDEQHRLLRAAVAESAGGKRKALGEAQLRLITGVAAHDAYHAGQIRMLRSMHEGAR